MRGGVAERKLEMVHADLLKPSAVGAERPVKIEVRRLQFVLRRRGAADSGRTRMLRKATGPWSAWNSSGPLACSFSRHTLPVGWATSTLSWISLPLSTTFSNRAFRILRPCWSKRGAEADGERLPLPRRLGRVDARGDALVNVVIVGL